MARLWSDDLNDAKAIRRRARGVKNPQSRRQLQAEADALDKRAARKLRTQRLRKSPSQRRRTTVRDLIG